MLPDFIDLLRCPETGQRLMAAPAELVEALEARRCAGTLQFSTNQHQINLAEPIEAALLREDGTACYPVQHGIPLLLPGHAVVCPSV